MRAADGNSTEAISLPSDEYISLTLFCHIDNLTGQPKGGICRSVVEVQMRELENTIQRLDRCSAAFHRPVQVEGIMYLTMST